MDAEAGMWLRDLKMGNDIIYGCSKAVGGFDIGK